MYHKESLYKCSGVTPSYILCVMISSFSLLSIFPAPIFLHYGEFWCSDMLLDKFLNLLKVTLPPYHHQVVMICARYYYEALFLGSA